MRTSPPQRCKSLEVVGGGRPQYYTQVHVALYRVTSELGYFVVSNYLFCCTSIILYSPTCLRPRFSLKTGRLRHSQQMFAVRWWHWFLDCHGLFKAFLELQIQEEQGEVWDGVMHQNGEYLLVEWTPRVWILEHWNDVWRLFKVNVEAWWEVQNRYHGSAPEFVVCNMPWRS